MTMSASQMGAHMERDIRDIDNVIGYKYEEFKKVCKKANPMQELSRVYTATCFNSRQKYYLVFNRRFMGGKMRIGSVPIAIVEDRNRTYYVVPKNPYDQQNVLYSSHLIERYAERMNIPYSMPSTLARYFKDNAFEQMIYKDDFDNPTSEVYAVNDGIILAQVTEDHKCIYRTFVSYDMLKDSQREAFEIVRNKLKSMPDDVVRLLQETGYDKHKAGLLLDEETKKINLEAINVYKTFFE